MNLEMLGLNPWLSDRIEPTKLDEFQLARVIAVNKDNYNIKNEKNEVIAEIAGKFMFTVESSLDYPAVGDWIYAQYFDADSFAIIHELLPRKSVLKRKTAGKKIEFQLIAANIDTAFIMQSVDSDYNIRRLERYLVMINEAHIRPVVLLSKSDLSFPANVEEKLSELLDIIPEIQTLAFSNLTGSGLDQINELLNAGETFCFLGSSGVGKTTLLNNLLGEDVFKIRAVREQDGKGKHTTARRQLTVLKNGAMIIDTPGMRELGNIGVASGLEETFAEIADLANQCRYADCTHIQASGCAVLSALDNRKISVERYNNYIKMKKESAFYGMSYLEKRQKDKQLGKFYKKTVMKHRKNRR